MVVPMSLVVTGLFVLSMVESSWRACLGGSGDSSRGALVHVMEFGMFSLMYDSASRGGSIPPTPTFLSAVQASPPLSLPSSA